MIARDLKRFFSHYQWFVEMGLGFCFLNGVNVVFYPADIGFLKAPLNPYWIVVLLAAVKYGLVPGVVSGFLAMLFVLIYHFGEVPGRMELEKFAESGDIFLPLCFLIAGTLLGGIRQTDLERSKEKDVSCAESKTALSHMKELYDAGERARRVLEARIVGETATFKTFYEQISKFESLDQEEIFTTCLSILASDFQVGRVSLYVKEGDFYVLKAAHGWDMGEKMSGKVSVRNHWMNLALEGKKIVTVRDMVRREDLDSERDPSGKVLAMIPFASTKGDFEGVVNIEQIDFLNLNTANLELMELVVRWASKSVEMIRRIQHFEEHSLYDETDGIFSFSYFKNCVVSEFKRSKASGSPVTAALFKIDRFGFMLPLEQSVVKKTVLVNLKRLLSDTDSIFRHRYEGIFLVLAPLRKLPEIQKIFGEVSGEAMHVGGKVIGDFSEWERGMKTPAEWIGPVFERAGLPALDLTGRL